ncbi:MAG: hypothetical protein KC431_26065, partial [Myxococcales bacterium]|nr:hypothetical protein [Myxococcales bacterium]
CHRHHRASEGSCPFCHTAVRQVGAPMPGKLGAMALVVGLSMLGCGGDDGNDDATTSDTSGDMTSDTSDTGDTTTDTTDSGGSDYGGAPPLAEHEEATVEQATPAGGPKPAK